MLPFNWIESTLDLVLVFLQLSRQQQLFLISESHYKDIFALLKTPFSTPVVL
jgi:hypothetical protein